MEKTALRKPLGCAAVALAAALLPAQAFAQQSSVNLAKGEAILGGAPSRLAEILAQQQGRATPAPLRMASLQPASFTARTPAYAMLRKVEPYSVAPATGRPDVFGSVALKVRRTPLDRRWNKVAGAQVTGAAAAFAASLRDADEMERVRAVNRYVNRRVEFVDDSRQYGSEDLWTAASDTLRRGRGDCEDYAIAKLQMLRSAGFADRDLYLVIVKDLVRRADHAVLVVRAGGHMLVLDNGTDLIADAASMGDYRPILTFAANGAWTHGYRRGAAPMAVAAASIASPVPSAAARAAAD